MEKYVPKGIEPYTKGSQIRRKFEQISNHAITFGELFQLKNLGKNEQGRVADLFTNTAFGYNSIADYNATLNLYKKSL